MATIRLLIFGLVLLLLLSSGALAEESEEALRQRLAGLIRTGGYFATLQAADQALKEHPKSVGAFQYRAFALQGLGRLAEAREAYEETVALDPKNWWAYMNLGNVLASLGQYEMAIMSGRMAVRLNPDGLGPHAKLIWIYRRAGVYDEAILAANRAVTLGVDPGFCHAELGYIYWVLGESNSSKEHWERARELGYDETACAHGLKLLKWDGRPSGSRRKRIETSERRGGEGKEWTFTVGQIEVITRMGPKMPRKLAKILTELQKDYGKFLGISGPWRQSIRLHLSRTLEEHERQRLRHFRLGPIDKAFLIRQPGGRRRGPGRGSPEWGLDLYVALAEPWIERSLSHELVHAMLHVRAPNSYATPTWFDEGLATYLELSPDRNGRPASGTTRTDFLEVIAGAREQNLLLGWVAMTETSSNHFTGATARLRYAQAWSMVHFLAEGYGRDGKRLLSRYIDLLNTSGMTPQAVLKQVYGRDIRKLEESWFMHIEALR